MNRFVVMLAGWASVSLHFSNSFACGPDPQKVVESIEVSAPVERVIETLRHPEIMPQWHPMIQDVHQPSTLPLTTEVDNPATARREIVFRNGWVLHEELRMPYKPEVIEDAWMDGGSFPVSQYRGVLQVKPTDHPGKVLLVWTARFNNRANTLEAPPGQDNAAAIAAVTDFYHQGLVGMKQYIESLSDKYSFNTKEN